MTSINKNEDLLLLEKNEEFICEMRKATTAEEAREVFAKFDVIISSEEAEIAFSKAASSEFELEEDELEQVSGGVVGPILAGIALIAFLIGLAKGSKCKTNN